MGTPFKILAENIRAFPKEIIYLTVKTLPYEYLDSVRETV